jgi:P-type conjugative transfer protein TrbJ
VEHSRYGPAWLLIAAVSSALPVPVMAFPVVCVNCSTNIQAMQASLAQARDYVESVQQTYNLVQSLKNQTTNLKRLGSMDWGNTEQQLRNLSNIASQGQAIAYSTANLNTRWNRHFQGMDGYEQQSIDDINGIDNYRARGDTLRDTAKSALSVANTMTGYQQEDNATLQRAQGHSAGAKGALQAAQANGELLAQVSRQLQKIQTLLQADIQMSSTYIASEVDRVDAEKVATNKLHRDTPTVDVTDGMDWSTQWGAGNGSW